MERGKGLWKRIASLILCLAMVVTLMPAQFAYAAEGDTTGRAGDTDNQDDLPETLMYFSFDDDITDGGKIKAEIVTRDDAAGTEHVAECAKDVKKVGTGALRLNGKNKAGNNAKGAYLKVAPGALANEDGSGKTKLTISYWSKVAPETGWGTGWVCFASEGDSAGTANKYVGVLDRSDHLEVECFNGGRGGSGSGANISATALGFKAHTEWKHVMIVMEDKELRMYVNGEKIAKEEIGSGIPNLANSTFYIGYATYGECYNGYLDDFTVYDGALTDAQAESIGKRAIVEDAIAHGIIDSPDGDNYNMNAGDTIQITPISTIPAAVRNQITYKSANPAVATVDEESGLVTAVAPGTTTIETTMRYSGQTYKGRTITVKVETPEEAFTPVATYTFEDAQGNGSIQGAKAISKGLVKYEGEIEYADGKDGVGKAVRTRASVAASGTGESAKPAVPGYGLELKEKNLGSAYTVSVWLKPDNAKAFHPNGPVLALGHGKSGDEGWLAIAGHNRGENSQARIWAHGKKYNISNTDFTTNPEGADSTTFEAVQNKWTMLTITQLGNNVTFYKDGVKTGKVYKADEVMNGANEGICLGVNFWDSEFNGLYDDVCIYDSALTAEQVKKLYVQDVDSDSMGIFADGEDYGYVKSDLTLPETFMGYDVTWTSQATDKIASDGKVNQAALDGSTVTLKATIGDAAEGAGWNKSFALKLAKPVTIKYVDETNAEVRKDTVYNKVGTKYTFKVTEDIISTATGAYQYDAENNKEEDFAIDVTAGGAQTITVKYKKLPVGSVDFSKLPADVYMIQGNKASLPKTAKGTITADDGTERPGTGDGGSEGADPIEIDVPIQWDDYSKLEPSATAYTLEGWAAGKKCSVKLHIFACDESVADIAAQSAGNAQKTKLEGAYKGVIETEYDIVMTGAFGTDDFGVQYYDKGVAQNADTFWAPAASTRFTKGKFFVNGGNGKGGSASESASTDYPAEADRAISHDGTSVYHVRTRIDTTGVSVTPGTPAEGETEATPDVTVGNGTFRVWVTDPNGVVSEVTDPENPMTSRKIVTGIIDKAGAAKANFKITNHKISWQSGYVDKKIEIYLGEETTAEKTTSEKLLPSSLLGEEAAAAAYAYTPASTYKKDDVKYVLNKQKSGWYKGATKIDNPADATVSVADVTLTYKAYYESGITNFAGLEESLNAAKAFYESSEAAGIYTAASLKALQDEITKAQGILDTQGTANPAASDVVDKAIEDLDALVAKGLDLKTFDEMDESMVAYYPLTKNVKDATDGGYDGKVIGSVGFDRSTGATFPGGSALANYITLPDTISVTDNMTFSFWAYDQNGGKNTFGIGSGKKLSNGSALDSSTTSAHHFSIYVRGEGKLRAGGGSNGWDSSKLSEVTADIDYSRWNLITCVLEGKKLTVYVNGAKAKEGTTGVSLTEAWNANEEERYIFLGNNIYGANNDADFKGSLKYFRMYNASLAEEQVKAIYDNELNSRLDTAAADLADELFAETGTGDNEGKYTMTITDTSMELPYKTKGPQGEEIRWSVENEEGAISIDAGVATVTLPETDTVTETLKASIRLNGGRKDVDVVCTLKKLSPEAQATRTELKEALKEAYALAETAYTTSSWASFAQIRDAAKSAYNKADDSMTAQNTALKNAMEEGGTLVPLGNKTALNRLIATAKRAMDKADKDDYEEKVWTDLETAITHAEELSDDIGQDEVDTEKAALQAAYDAFKPKTYTKEQADKLAAEAKKLLEGKNEFEYDEKVWAAMQDALKEIAALTANSTVEQTTAAYNKLKDAMEAFEPKTIDKEALGTLVTDVKGQLAGLNKADYQPTAWAAVEAALAEVERLPATASEAEVKAAYGKLWNAMKKLKASPFVAVSSVKMSKTSLTLAVKKTATLTATVAPSNATNQKKEWSTSNQKIAKVDQNGKVTAVAKGTATITVKVDGKTATCKVTVTVPVTKVTITESLGGGKKPAVAAGKKITLKAGITPSNANNKSVTWSLGSKDKKYASISSKGVLSAKKAGAGKTVTVTATAKDGSKKKATVKVKIMKNAVTKITLKAGKKTVKAGKKITVKATVKTNGKKASKTLAWSVDKKSKKYASINSKGVLSTKKAGKNKTVTVTAAATDGSKKKATIKIKIKK